MASRYYNPRLAQKVGAAISEQYVSIEPAIEKGRIAYQREEAKQLRKQQLEFEKRKLEAAEFAKEMKRRDDVLYTAQKDLYKSEKNFDTAPPAVKARVTNLLVEAKENTAALNSAIKNGSVTKGQSVEYTDAINKKVKKAERLLELYPEIVKNYSENKPSMINSSTDIKISNKIGAGEFEIAEIESEDKVIVKNDNNEIIATIPLDEAVNPTYIPEDYEAFATAFSTVNEAAKKAASKGESIDNMKQDVKSALSTLNFTPEQSLSIAFDYLGKERPEYINIEDYRDADGNIDIAKFKTDKVTDLNNDGNIDENELNSWIKSQLVEAAENAYDGYKKDYADKFEPDTPTATEEKEKQTQQNINFATDQLNKMKLPKTPKGMIDVDSTVFNRLLNNLNLSVDPQGSYVAGEKKIIKVKSNITNKTLNIMSDMPIAEFNRTLLMLSGATPEEAMKRYPDQSGPVEESEVINIGSLPVKK